MGRRQEAEAPGATLHPHKDEWGQDVVIHNPHTASPEASWSDPSAVSTFTPGSPAPAFHGEHRSFLNHGVEKDAGEFPHEGPKSAGMVLMEGRHVWLTTPTNNFGGFQYTFPKGGHEPGTPTLQHTALKELHEETGLTGEITGHVGDYEGFHDPDGWNKASRFYIGHRTGGSPSDMGWESQALHRVPVERLHEFLHNERDLRIAKTVQTMVAAGHPATQYTPREI